MLLLLASSSLACPDQQPPAPGPGTVQPLSAPDAGAGTAGCKRDADCSGNPGGPLCDIPSGRCVCKADADCKVAPYTLCVPPFVDASRRECGKPCTEKAHCGAGLFCHKLSGRCVECKSDADCADTALPFCDTTSNVCAGCRTDNDCQAYAVFGGRCVTAGGVRRCGCAVDAHCATSAHGSVCSAAEGRCGCTSDAHCWQAPGRSCKPAYPGASHSLCQGPCRTDQDCPGKLASHCDAASGRCVTCTTDAHCAGRNWSRVCDAKNARCVECLRDSHCTSQTLGSACKGGTCNCSSGSDCKGNLNGALCHGGFKVCSCTTDSDCPAGRKCAPSTLGGTIKLCKAP
ncbi:MAG: hypothetical protein PVI30_28225 [Myxococcales bacterium]